MRSGFARVGAFAEALLRDRRPRRFRADAEEAEMMRVTAALRAARPGAGEPSPEFIDGLARRLRSQIDTEESGGPSMHRRRFLQAAAVAAAAAAAGVVGDRLVGPADRPDLPRRSDELVPTQGHWVGVSSVAAVVPGRPARFSAGGVEGFVVNDGRGFSAVSAICTHLGCTLTGDARRRRLLCPCHGSEFSLDGAPAAGDYELAPLPRIRTRTRDGTIEVFVATDGPRLV